MQKIYSLKKLNEIGQGDEKFVHDMLVTFVENVTVDVDKIQSARSLEDWTTIGHIAHKMVPRFA